MSAPAFPDRFAERDPERAAYVIEPSGVVVTYGQLVSTSRRWARVLRDAGIGLGDGIAVVVGNQVGFLEATWAAQRSGLRYTAVNHRLTAAEVAYIIDDCGARAVITSVALAELVQAALAHARDVETLLCVDGAPHGFTDLRSVAVADEPLPDEVEGVDMLYSSGTTGQPKGVSAPLPFAPLGTPPGIVGLMQDRWGLQDGSVYLTPAPLYHSAPMRFTMALHRVGATGIVMERFDAEGALALIERHRVTHTQMVPTMFVRLLRLPRATRDAYDLSSLRVVIHAAAPCPPDIKRAMIDWLGPIVYEYYAATENHFLTVITSQEWLEHPGSVGRPLVGIPHVVGDDGHEVRVGEVGTVWSEGGPEFTYHNDPEKTAASRNERGWSTVGDLGYLDEEGFLYLSDRRADLIICGGVNVYPREAEDVLLSHSEVADAGVFGIPDEDLGEVVHAVVAPERGVRPDDMLAAELLTYLEGRLARFKCPRAIDFRDQLPRHATGKLYKRILRDEYVARAKA